MRVVIIIALVVLALPTITYLAVRYAPRRGIIPGDNVDVPAFQNHQHMARTLDHLVNNDMIYIPDGKRREIEGLLSDFYGNYTKSITKGK